MPRFWSTLLASGKQATKGHKWRHYPKAYLEHLPREALRGTGALSLAPDRFLQEWTRDEVKEVLRAKREARAAAKVKAQRARRKGGQ